MTGKSLPPSNAFLLTQLGTLAASTFADLVAGDGLTPPHAGMLRVLAGTSGLSQQDLASRLGMLPSRVVGFVDELEAAGLVERVRDETDRRRNCLVLTSDGHDALATIGRLAQKHDDIICAALSRAERAQLGVLLQRIADDHHMRPGVHPGYRSLRRP